VLAVISAGLSWVFLYPLIIKWVIRSHYAKAGWQEIPEGKTVVSNPAGAHSTRIRILSAPPAGDYQALSEIAVKLTRWSPIERKYTREDIDQRLREKAMALGANAIVNVQYVEKGDSWTNAGSIEGKGLAIVDDSDTTTCPFCAERIKRAATRCKHCGSDIGKAA